MIRSSAANPTHSARSVAIARPSHGAATLQHTAPTLTYEKARAQIIDALNAADENALDRVLDSMQHQGMDRLELSGTRLDHKGIACLTNVVQRRLASPEGFHIRHIDLSNTSVSRSLDGLMNSLANSGKCLIESLDLSGASRVAPSGRLLAGLDAATIVATGNLANRCQHLVELRLNEQKNVDCNYFVLSHILQSNVKHLELRNCNLGRNCLFRLVEATPQLKQLDVRDNPGLFEAIDENDRAAFMQTLANNKKLQTLLLPSEAIVAYSESTGGCSGSLGHLTANRTLLRLFPLSESTDPAFASLREHLRNNDRPFASGVAVIHSLREGKYNIPRDLERYLFTQVKYHIANDTSA